MMRFLSRKFATGREVSKLSKQRPNHLNLQPGLFQNLAQKRLIKALPGINMAGGELPISFKKLAGRAPKKQQAPLTIGDESACDHAIRLLH